MSSRHSMWIGIGILVAFTILPAHATLLFTLTQVGSNVVLTGSGTANLAGLTFDVNGGDSGFLNPSGSSFVVGSSGSDSYYKGTFSGPASFGAGGPASAGSGTGNIIGFDPTFVSASMGVLVVPLSYTSGNALSGSATFSGTTLAALGATPGVYVWTWGSGANADSMTLNVGDVPETGTSGLTGVALAAVVAFRRKFLLRT